MREYFLLFISLIFFSISICLIFYSYYSKKKLLKNLHRIIDAAMEDNFKEESLDETMISALENKLSKYLRKNNLKAMELQIEREKIKSLISDISHQTKTPITNIILYSALLKEEVGSKEDLRLMVTEIEKQGEKLKFLIDALINSSRLETGIINIKTKKNSSLELVVNAMVSVDIESKKKNINIINEVEDKEIEFDMKWTTEALYNIIQNAVKYTDEKGVIKITSRDYEFFYRIDIEDNGIGILEEDKSKIFKRFYRAEEVGEIEGIGVGLFLANEIITAEKGYIKVSSMKGKGSKFSIFLSKG